MQRSKSNGGFNGVEMDTGKVRRDIYFWVSKSCSCAGCSTDNGRQLTVIQASVEIARESSSATALALVRGLLRTRNIHCAITNPWPFKMPMHSERHYIPTGASGSPQASPRPVDLALPIPRRMDRDI